MKLELIHPLTGELVTQPGLSLDLPADLSFEDWCAFGRQLFSNARVVNWWIGDWWASGYRGYGDRARAAAEGIFGREFQTLVNAGNVSRSFETNRRRLVLSWSHHVEVAPLPAPIADYLLDQAESEGWSVRDLRAAVQNIRRGERIEKIEQISAGNESLDTSRRYPIILADPPWRYENPPMGGSNRSIENHYPTMTLDEICALPVEQIAADDALLYLWATAPKLAECLDVIDAWGFEYRTNIVWVKDKIGMGYHARSQHELLLIAKRGTMPPPIAGQQPSSVIEAPRQEHSAKPAIFAETIERLYPGVGRIELFCRSPRPGWDVWGNQSGAGREAA